MSKHVSGVVLGGDGNGPGRPIPEVDAGDNPHIRFARLVAFPPEETVHVLLELF